MKLCLLFAFIAFTTTVVAQGSNKTTTATTLIVPIVDDKCKNIKCSAVEDPKCVRVKNKDNPRRMVYVLAINKCELQYIKCSKGYEAEPISMKKCIHFKETKLNDRNNTYAGHTRVKRSVEPGKSKKKMAGLDKGLGRFKNGKAGKLKTKKSKLSRSKSGSKNKKVSKKKMAGLSKRLGKFKNGKVLRQAASAAELSGGTEDEEGGYAVQYDKIYDDKAEVLAGDYSSDETPVNRDKDSGEPGEGKDPGEDAAKNIGVVVKIVDNKEPDDSADKLAGDISTDGDNSGVKQASTDDDTSDYINYTDSDKISDDIKVSGDDQNSDGDKVTGDDLDSDNDKVSGDDKIPDDDNVSGDDNNSSDNKADMTSQEHEESQTNEIDFVLFSKETATKMKNPPSNEGEEQEQDDCPTSCPSRLTMICGRCEHGVYRTFMSLCHMKMFACQPSGETLQLVARYPCMLSAPYMVEKKMVPEGRLQVPRDTDQVLQYVKCRERGQLGSDDPRCQFASGDDEAQRLQDTSVEYSETD